MDRVRPAEPDVHTKLIDETFACPVCLDERPVADMVVFDPCGHIYCKPCVMGYLGNKITSADCVDVHCPYPKCTTLLQYHEIKSLVTPELFAKFESFSLQAALKADATVRWCPKPGCGIALFGDTNEPHMRCTCGHEYCFLCGEDWHEGATCEQYQKWKADQGMVDKKFAEWTKGNSKKCPNCKAETQKNEGCNHMTCASCKYQWCWLCGQQYTPGHFEITNLRGCPGMQSGATENFGCITRIAAKTAVVTGLVLSVIGTFSYSIFMPGNPTSVHGALKICGAIVESTLGGEE